MRLLGREIARPNHPAQRPISCATTTPSRRRSLRAWLHLSLALHCFVQPGLLHAETLPLFIRVPAAAAAKMIIPVRCFTCGKVTRPSPLSSCSRGRRAGRSVLRFSFT